MLWHTHPAHSLPSPSRAQLFPYLMYASMYRDLAASAGLYYYKVNSEKPEHVPENGAAFLLHEEPFERQCDGTERHISSPAAFLDYECNWRSKSSPLQMPLGVFEHVLNQALDDIGCRDSFCEAPGLKYVDYRARAFSKSGEGGG